MTKQELRNKFTAEEMKNPITARSIEERWLNSEWANEAEERARKARFMWSAWRGYQRLMEK